MPLAQGVHHFYNFNLLAPIISTWRQVRQTLQHFVRSTEIVRQIRKKKIMQLRNDDRSGQSETATSVHEFCIYRLKHLQQRKRHIIFQIFVGFSQLLQSHSHWREAKIKKNIIHTTICWWKWNMANIYKKMCISPLAQNLSDGWLWTGTRLFSTRWDDVCSSEPWNKPNVSLLIVQHIFYRGFWAP
jgi:hypothetical protein